MKADKMDKAVWDNGFIVIVKKPKIINKKLSDDELDELKMLIEKMLKKRINGLAEK